MKYLLNLFVVLLCSYTLYAGAPDAPKVLYQQFVEANGTTTSHAYYMFWWNRVPGATKYKIINKAYTPKSQKYVGEVIVAEVTDSFKQLMWDDYEKILSNYEKTVDSQYLQECESGVCLFGLAYHSYLVAVNDDGESPQTIFDFVSSTTAITHLDKQQRYIYPNPSTGILNVVLPSITGKIKYMLLNSEGRIVMQSSTSKQIDITHLPGGQYLLQIRFNNQLHTEKIHLVK